MKMDGLRYADSFIIVYHLADYLACLQRDTYLPKNYVILQIVFWGSKYMDSLL